MTLNNVLRRLITCIIIALPLSVISQSTYSYTESYEDFPNPERGFYRYSQTSSSNYTPLNSNTLRSYRNLSSVFSADYDVVSTLVFRYFVLEDFIQSPITASFLDNVKLDFEAARSGGVKIIPRFVYTTTANSGACGSICPPFGDASKERVLEHISQLKPILQEYADVIAVLQMGFIGIWGEQYYTDHFGYPSNNGGDGKITNENWIKRNEVITALLDALPKNRMMQVRYPQQKQRYVYGVLAPVTSAPLTIEEAYNESDKARIGLYNDCFLSSWTDVGTYSDYGNDNQNTRSDTSNLKPYMAEDSKYTVIGGETCRDDFSPYNKCHGSAVNEMERMNYSYLNAHYNNPAVNNHWVTGGCIDEIKRRLGYRFVLRNSTIDNHIVQNTAINISIDIDNVGFASLYNPRNIELVLRNLSTNETFHLPFPDIDIRFWQKGSHNINKIIPLPNTIPTGSYECLLNFPDMSTNLRNNPDYSIRLANQDVWEASTGYNKLNHTIVITPINHDLCSSVQINIDGNTEDWAEVPVTLYQNNTYFKVFDNDDYIAFLIQGNTNINNQFFIDTDENANTGYSTLAWSNFGADYSIENGVLRSYTGTGFDDWNWEAITSLEYIVNNNIIELKLNKDLIPTSNFKIGYRNLDTDWNIQFNLPTEGIATNYNYQCNITDVEKVIQKNIAQVFPTVSDHHFNIHFTTPNTQVLIKVHTPEGKIVYQETQVAQTNPLTLGKDFTQGIYILTVQSKDELQTFKIIKK